MRVFRAGEHDQKGFLNHDSAGAVDIQFLVDVTLEENGEDAKRGVSLGDFLAALFHHTEHGLHCSVDVSSDALFI